MKEEIKLADVLLHLRPNAEFVIRGGTYDGIEWLDKTQTKPTEIECEEGFAAMKQLDYRYDRASAYPPIGDQLDALWKGGDEFNAMKKKVEAVKAQYPKP